tara:strand:+ start:9749 stop:11632 length:1884 start_codon:yes stop_codon:yes gene_type:complete
MKLGRLKSLGVNELWQVPLCMPESLKDYRYALADFTQVYQMTGSKVLVKGCISCEPTTQWVQSKPTLNITLQDSNGYILSMKLFGDNRKLQESLSVGDEVYFSGISFVNGQYLNLRAAHLVDPHDIGKLVAEYKGKTGVITPQLTRKLINEHLNEALSVTAAKFREVLIDIESPRQLLKAKHLNLEEALFAIHHPKNEDEWLEAKTIVKRLAALYCVKSLKADVDNSQPEKVTPFTAFDFESLLPNIPFALTDEQREISLSLCQQLREGIRISAILNGDVGTGKTVTYGLLAAACVSAGGRVAIMLPSTNLAKQIHQEIMLYWPALSPILLTGESAEVDITHHKLIIGTSALLFRDVGHFDCVIIDEQQRFGLKQREQLISKHTHYLEVTATPIPRTQALIKFSNLTVYRLKKCHSEKVITTKMRLKSESSALMSECLDQINQGNKVLVVCPVKEGESEMQSVELVAKKWQKYAKGKVRLIHSGCTAKENEKALNHVKTGKANVLIATSIVEIGITIPKLTKAIIYHAERFGTITCHQIRGRLVRNGGVGQLDLYCPTLISDKSLERLSLLTRYDDGFELATQDMQLRGFGDIEGGSDAKQHGDTRSILVGEKVSFSDVEEILSALT